MHSDLHAPGTVRARPMGVAVAASLLGHAALLALAIGLARPPVPLTTPIVVFPISLVGRPGGGAGGGTGGGEPAPAPPPQVEAPQPVPEPVAVAHPKPAPKPKPAPAKRPEPAAVASRPATSSGTGDVATADGVGSGRGGGSGVGDGAGSGGTSASPGYGTNPEPPYPMAARRLGLEGEVILRVFVAADGRPTNVVVLRSSGHAVLDESAADTVRTRWRFVPATRGGVPIDDTVQVPIRFRRSAG